MRSPGKSFCGRQYSLHGPAQSPAPGRIFCGRRPRIRCRGNRQSPPVTSSSWESKFRPAACSLDSIKLLDPIWKTVRARPLVYKSSLIVFLIIIIGVNEQSCSLSIGKASFSLRAFKQPISLQVRTSSKLCFESKNSYRKRRNGKGRFGRQR